MTDWQIGWMSAAVTISDIASMGAEPCVRHLSRWGYLTVGAPRRDEGRRMLQVRRRDCPHATGTAGWRIFRR